jgi:hypothetical protein
LGVIFLKNIENVAKMMVEAYENADITLQSSKQLPDKEQIISVIDDLQALFFPAYFSGSKSAVNNVPESTKESLGKAESNPYANLANVDKTRRQVFGDEAIVAKGIRTGWADVFELEGDRFLASFAIPGVKAGQRNTSLKEFEAAINSKCEITPADSPEARQIKAMVEGMKDEARQYIAAGGTIVDYGKRLTERQDAEIAIYERIKSEIEKAKESLSEDEFMDVWERRNEELRNLGIKTVGLE